MNYLSARLREPSTWAGIAALLPIAVQASSGHVDPQMVGAIAAGLAAVFMREQPGHAV